MVKKIKTSKKKKKAAVNSFSTGWKYVLGMMFTLTILVLLLNFWVVSSTRAGIVRDKKDLPVKKVGLLLGTSKKTTKGASNRFFRERVEAAAELYRDGLIQHIIVSGDNRTVYYNEPRDMYKDLRDLGVPERAITLDYAGLRTLDSVVRSKLVFGQNDVLIITQSFHCYRALFIADYYQMDVLAYDAGKTTSIPLTLALREVVARSLAVVDLYLLNKKPKHLGKEKGI